MPLRATDYQLDPREARAAAALAVLPDELRQDLLRRYLRQMNAPALIRLASQLIGMANSVIANNREMIELLGITKAGEHPHQVENYNLPGLLGAALGAELAHGIDPGPLCAGCAYRLGSPANQCLPTITDATDTISNGEAFLCHEKLDARGQPRQKCRGHIQALRRRHTRPDAPA